MSRISGAIQNIYTFEAIKMLKVKPVTISFCIPTLNRLHTIRLCIDSVLEQLYDEDEIIIVDGGSTDNTVSSLSSWYAGVPRVKILRNPTETGLGADLVKAISHAKGDYCWLFSDDDVLFSGVLSKVKTKLAAYPDVAGATTNYQSFDSELRGPISTAVALLGHSPSCDRFFTDARSSFRAFGMHLGYLTCQLVNRSKCLEVIARNMDSHKLQSPWIVTYLVGYLQLAGSGWLYISDVCVMNRIGNDSFLRRLGEHKRQIITHCDFPAVVAEIFPKDNSVVNTIRKNFLLSRMPRSIIRLKSQAPSMSMQFSVLRLYMTCYRQHLAFWAIAIPMLMVPSAVYRQVVRLYFLYIKISQGRR